MDSGNGRSQRTGACTHIGAGAAGVTVWGDTGSARVTSFATRRGTTDGEVSWCNRRLWVSDFHKPNFSSIGSSCVNSTGGREPEQATVNRQGGFEVYERGRHASRGCYGGGVQETEQPSGARKAQQHGTEFAEGLATRRSTE